MAGRLETVLETVRKTGTVDEASRREIQRVVYDDGSVSLAEAEALFAINDAADTDACPEWPWVFIGAITDILVRQSIPRDRIDGGEAVWLLRHIQKDGVVREGTELELLLNILKYAESAPSSLEHLALATVEGHIEKNGFVTAEDVERLRQILYACGSSGGVGICRMEAEALFRIAEATQGAVNDDSFKDLFVGALANHLMMSEIPPRLSDEEALRREYWLHERGDIASGWARAFRNPIKTFLDARRDDTKESAPVTWLDEERLSVAERVSGTESRWLVDRIARDGVRSELEQALLDFLAEESPYIHATLRQAIERAA